MAVNHLRDSFIAFENQQRRHLLDHVPDSSERPVHKAFKADVINFFRLFQKLEITICIIGIKASNLGERVFNTGAIVKLTTIGKVKAIEGVQRYKI